MLNLHLSARFAGFLFCAAVLLTGCSSRTDDPDSAKQVVIVAGEKSHAPDLHEYLKSARLIKALLDRSENLDGVETEVFEGWPRDASVLQRADLLLTLSDGPDGPNGRPTPFMTVRALEEVQELVDRGGGFMTFHFSTFAPDSIGENMLAWSGGYFDWQNDAGEREWYSAIDFADTTVVLQTREHPVSRGLPATFRLHDEYYYQMRFRHNDPRLQPLLDVPSLGSVQPLGNTVAWGVERSDGGRGFGTTIGHFMKNWEDVNFRKFVLNAIVWTAGAEVPEEGVESPFLSDREVTRVLFAAEKKLLIVTGHHHPGHNWQETTPVLVDAIASDSLLHVDVTTSIGDLSEIQLSDYGALVLNYCNWEQPDPLGDSGKEALLSYVADGGGLIVVHFANGAFHFSLPEAEASDWPAYRQLVRRVWDHTSDSAHDALGQFVVNPTDIDHPIVAGMAPFETTDELYYNQKGDLPIEVLLTARSNDTGQDEPVAFVYQHGNGRVFQTLLGHDASSLNHPSVRELMRRSARWVVGL